MAAWTQEVRDSSNATTPLSNMLLVKFTMITNLHPVFYNKIIDDRRALAHTIACCSLLLLGSGALTSSIIQQVWGANNTIQKILGGPRGYLTLIQQRLVLLFKIVITTLHWWATIHFDNAPIINDKALHCYPSGLRDIITDPSRIPPLLNMCENHWHQALHTSTSC